MKNATWEQESNHNNIQKEGQQFLPSEHSFLRSLSSSTLLLWLVVLHHPWNCINLLAHFGHGKCWNYGFKAKENPTRISCPGSQVLSKQTLLFSKLPEFAPSYVCFLLALQDSKPGAVFSMHTTFPTWALFSPEEKEMWPFLVICGTLQLTLSCAWAVPIPVCSCVTSVCASAAPGVLRHTQMHHTGRFQRCIFIVPGIEKQVNISSASTKLLPVAMHPRFVSSKIFMAIISPVFSFPYGCGWAVLYCTVLFSCSQAALCTLSY